VATADDLTAAGEHALTRYGVSTLVVNMAAVTFMSAAGIGALVSINNNAHRQGQVVIVVEASRYVFPVIVADLEHAGQPRHLLADIEAAIDASTSPRQGRTSEQQLV
jgi:hypothetical protein